MRGSARWCTVSMRQVMPQRNSPSRMVQIRDGRDRRAKGAHMSQNSTIIGALIAEANDRGLYLVTAFDKLVGVLYSGTDAACEALVDTILSRADEIAAELARTEETLEEWELQYR